MSADKPKIRKLKLPLKKMSKREKDYVAVLLDDVNYNFKAFGESLDAVKKRGDETFEEVGRMKVEMTGIKEEITGIKGEITEIKGEMAEIKKRLDAIEKRLDNLEKKPVATQAMVESLRQEGAEIKASADDPEIHKRLNFFDKRLARVEKQLKLKAVSDF